MSVDTQAATDRLMRFLAIEGVTGKEAAIGREISAALQEVGVPDSAIPAQSASCGSRSGWLKSTPASATRIRSPPLRPARLTTRRPPHSVRIDSNGPDETRSVGMQRRWREPVPRHAAMV